MIKVAICDDDIQFIYKLEQSIFRFAEMKRIKVDVDGYTSGAEFIQKLQQSERYDLLFLDIELSVVREKTGRSAVKLQIAGGHPCRLFLYRQKKCMPCSFLICVQ